MLRFATWKIIAILALTLAAVLVVVPSMLAPASLSRCPPPSPPGRSRATIVLGLDLQGGSHVMLEVDQASVAAHAGRQSARRRPPHPARGEGRDDGRHRRAGARRAAAHPGRRRPRQRCCRNSATLSRSFAGAEIGGRPPLDVDATSATALVQIVVTDAGVTDKVRHAVDQSIEVLRRRVDALGTTRAHHPAPGRRPHPRAGAGPAGPRAAQGNSRPDRQARIPPRRRAGPEPVRNRGARPGRRAGQARHREADHGAGRGSDRRPAGLRPAARRRAGRQFPLQHPRRAEIRRGDLARMSAGSSPSCSTTR